METQTRRPDFLGKNSWHEALQRNRTFVPAEHYSNLIQGTALVLHEAGRSRFSSSLPSPEFTKAAAEQERCPGGQGQGLGMMFLDDYKINAASWPVHKAQRPKRPHKALASSIQVVPKLAP